MHKNIYTVNTQVKLVGSMVKINGLGFTDNGYLSMVKVLSTDWKVGSSTPNSKVTPQDQSQLRYALFPLLAELYPLLIVSCFG